MQINQHPNQAQAVFSTVSSKPPPVAKQQDAPAIASTRVEAERDTVELIRPNIQAIAQLLDSDGLPAIAANARRIVPVGR